VGGGRETSPSELLSCQGPGEVVGVQERGLKQSLVSMELGKLFTLAEFWYSGTQVVTSDAEVRHEV